MSLAVTEMALLKNHDHRSTPAAPITWAEIPRSDLAKWNDVLLGTDTSLYQYPFWNEPYRPLLVTPRYVVWGNQAGPLAFVSILTVGFGPFKIGMVFRGPACIESNCARCRLAVAQLVEWARDQGYMFLRVTHSDPQVLSQLAASARCEDFDAFPYFLDYPLLSPDYIVEQADDDEETLSGFDREVRRKLRRANELGYELRSDDSPEAFAEAWPLYQECARRKQFRLERPLSFYLETIRLARPHGCARIFSAYAGGKIIGNILVFRDAVMAHSHLAATDHEHRKAAVLLHWYAMREMYHRGARRYNMGPGPRSLARFKEQFCRTPVSYPGAVTVVLNGWLFAGWRRMILPAARSMRPLLRSVVSHLKN